MSQRAYYTFRLAANMTKRRRNKANGREVVGGLEIGYEAEQ
jgi:hypothetical protein